MLKTFPALKYKIKSKVKAGIFFIAALFATLFAQAQNLYDTKHTEEFAGYLFRTEQYEFAAEEFERLVFLNPDSVKYRISLLQAYRLNGKYATGINKIHLFYDTISTLPITFSREYVKLNLLDGKNRYTFDYLNRNKTLPESEKINYQLTSLLLDKKWTQAQQFTEKKTISNSSLVTLTAKSKEIKYKSPALAACFSAFIPGTGKIYSKSWKDGLISLLFVAANTWQAYRGFSKNGTDSAYGWIFATLSVGFYGGNIYGSYKTAKKYNQRLDNALYQEVQRTTIDNWRRVE